MTTAAAVRAYLFNSELRALESFCYSLSLSLCLTHHQLFFSFFAFLSFSFHFSSAAGVSSLSLSSLGGRRRGSLTHTRRLTVSKAAISLSVAQQPLFPSFLLSPKCENVPLLGCWLSVCVVLTETLDCCGVLRSLFALELELPPLYE